MTTIVFRDGVMASDSGAWVEGIVTPWAKKVIQGKSGALYGGCGSAARVSEFFAWVRDGEVAGKMVVPQVRDDGSDFIVLIWRPESGLFLLTSGGEEDLRGYPYCAVGGGAAVAYGAFHHGATAVEAVKAAIAHSDCAAGEVQYLVAR